MRKLIGILALVMILCMTMVLPGLAVKIAPYSQPLHDIMHWDAKSAKLIVVNPEGEGLTVAWPATVDLWNYDGNTWTFDLPTGDNFAFDKIVNIDLETGAVATGAVRSGVISLTLTEDCPSPAYQEVLNVTLNSQYITGMWANAIMARIIFDPDGDARGGMAAVYGSEMYLPDVISPGGSYYNYESLMSAPTSWDGSDQPLTRVVAFEHYVAGGAAVTNLDDNAVLFHLEGVTTGSEDMFFLADLTVTKADGLLKINVNGTAYYMFITTAVNGGD